MFNSENREKGTLFLIGGKITRGKSESEKICQEIIQHAGGEKMALLAVEPIANQFSAYFQELGTKNVSAFLFDKPQKANSSELCQQLESFPVLFIPDGPKSEYFNSWKQSLLIQTIQNAYLNGKIIVGEGTGAAILGEITYFNKNGSLQSVNLFKNPFIQSLFLEENFIPLLPGTLIDTNFAEDGGLLRLLPLLARCAIQKSRRIKGIGIDQNTAMIIDSNLIGRVFGTGQVTILSPTPKSQVRFEFCKPPEYTHLAFHQLSAGMNFNFNAPEANFQPETDTNAEIKPKFSLPGNPLVFFGKNDYDLNSRPENSTISQGTKLLCREGGNLTILTSEQFQELAIEFSNSLRLNCHSELAVITLNENKHEYEIQAKTIKKSSGIIFSGNNLSQMIGFLRSSNPVAKAFRSRLNAGIPLGFVSNAIQLAGRWILCNAPQEFSNETEIPTIDGLNYLKGSILMPNLTASDPAIGKRVTQFFKALNQKSAKLGILFDSESFAFLNERKNLIFTGASATILIDRVTCNLEKITSDGNPGSLVHLVHDDFEFDLRSYELRSVARNC